MKKGWLFYSGAWVLAISICAAAACRKTEPDIPGPEISSPPELTLDRATAAHLSELALHCIRREYPNKPGHVINDAADVHNPSVLHPAFFGCYDWHSSVHGHWMLVRLLKRFPDLENAEAIRSAIDSNLTPDNLAVEAAYFSQPNRKSFERTYGWAWLLKLAEELRNWENPDARRWSENLRPLAGIIVRRYLDFLPRQTYPIRRGVHPNTAFGLAFALDYARAAGNRELEELVLARSLEYFHKDRDCPGGWEPDGDDFFSRCLMEADLMRRVLSPEAFTDWFHNLLPDLEEGRPASLLEPADVADRSDPKIGHLDGLNLSRAWCMESIAAALPETDPLRPILRRSASRHAAATFPHIASGNYAGEHWLASFAVFYLSTLEK